jgi:hypothetical protein
MAHQRPIGDPSGSYDWGALCARYSGGYTRFFDLLFGYWVLPGLAAPTAGAEPGGTTLAVTVASTSSGG